MTNKVWIKGVSLKAKATPLSSRLGEPIRRHICALASRTDAGTVYPKPDPAGFPLTGKALATYRFPLPSVSEQSEIVRRVGMLFALADQIEARFAKGKARVDQLTQSILAKALRGELVPQDSNDEPASVLLEWIKAERTGKNSGTKKRK